MLSNVPQQEIKQSQKKGEQKKYMGKVKQWPFKTKLVMFRMGYKIEVENFHFWKWKSGLLQAH